MVRGSDPRLHKASKMRRNLLNRTMFVMVCVMGLVTTAQSLVTEHPSLQDFSMIATDFHVSEDDVPSLKDVNERHLPKVNEEKLARETTDRGIQESLNRSFMTDSRVIKVFHRMQRETSQLNSLKLKRQRQIDSKVRSVVSEIKNGKIAEANQLLVELGDDTLLERIVKETYANNITHLDSIIWFVKNLPYLQQDAIAYTTLLEEMKKNQHLETPQLTVLAYQVKETMEMPNYNNLTEDTKSKFNLLKGALREPIQNIQRIILTGSFERVKAFARQKIALSETTYVEHIVKLLYANGNDNTEKILKFVRGFRTIQLSAIGYVAVHKEMRKYEYWNKDGGTLFTFGALIKETMEMPNYSQLEQFFKNIFETLKLKLPDAVRHILWDDVYIKNKKYNGYFYGGGFSYINSGFRQTFVEEGSLGKQSVLDIGKWKFQSVNNDYNNFRIYSPYFNEYLHVCILTPSACMHVDEKVYSDSVWELFLVDQNKNIVIKNKSTGQFIYASSDNSENIRKIKLAHESEPYNDKFIWQVEK